MKKRNAAAFILFFAVTLLFAGCSNSPEGHRSEQEQKAVPGSNEEFFEAVHAGDLELVASLLRAGADINAKEKDGRTALLIAAEKGDAGMALLLAERGADLNVRDADGHTALMYAAYKGNLELTGVFLKHGADVHAKDNDGWTARRFALLQGKTEVAELLRRHGSGRKRN